MPENEVSKALKMNGAASWSLADIQSCPVCKEDVDLPANTFQLLQNAAFQNVLVAVVKRQFAKKNANASPSSCKTVKSATQTVNGAG